MDDFLFYSKLNLAILLTVSFTAAIVLLFSVHQILRKENREKFIELMGATAFSIAIVGYSISGFWVIFGGLFKVLR